jgi:hypothetical protein
MSSTGEHLMSSTGEHSMSSTGEHPMSSTGEHPMSSTGEHPMSNHQDGRVVGAVRAGRDIGRRRWAARMALCAMEVIHEGGGARRARS